VSTVGRGGAGSDYQGQAVLFETSAAAFLAHAELQDEVFGASSLIVRCEDQASLTKVIQHLQGQLTIALHIEPTDHEAARNLLPLLEQKAGRLIVNGFGTGVEVGHAMVHGGPFPATSDSRTTSVGSLAIARFLRPVSYQSFPADLIPDELSDANPHRVPQQMNPA